MRTSRRKFVIMACISIFLTLFLNGCGEDDPVSSDDNEEGSCTVIFDQHPDQLQGAGWNLNGVVNRSGSGDTTLTGIPAGGYISTWNAVTGYSTPPPDTFKLSPDDTAILSGIYEEELILKSSLMINELFFCGSDASSFYFYDQFCELYNGSSDTLYLDGMIITRQRPVEADVEDPPLDYVRAIFAYQFPGTPVTGREYPIAPGEIVVIAADAMDHTENSENSVDLSNADWETYNFEKYDFDNPEVPNLIALNPQRGTDWMVNLSHDAVVLATGENWALEEYVNSSGYVSTQIVIPLDDVIDGVEYSTSLDVKYLTVRVDQGFAGMGISKYSGYSTERRALGLDSNNSTFDFVNTGPTPGYSHVE